MTNAEFGKRVKAARLRGRSVEACRLVLVQGVTVYRASKMTGINQSAIHKMMRKIPIALCPTCGGPTN